MTSAEASKSDASSAIDSLPVYIFASVSNVGPTAVMLPCASGSEMCHSPLWSLAAVMWASDTSGTTSKVSSAVPEPPSAAATGSP